MSPAQQRACDELLPRYGVEVAAPLDFPTIFGRRAPVVLEIGFGMGETTAAIAAAQPDVDFLGVEMHLPGSARCCAASTSRGSPTSACCATTPSTSSLR